MNTEGIILLVVAVVVVLAAVAMLARRRKQHDLEQRQVQADQLRHQAADQVQDVRGSDLRAKEAEAEATLAQARAERAEQEAAAVNREAAVEQARHEDVVREADRIDPDVDHRSDGYTPTTGSPTAPTAPTTLPAPLDGTPTPAAPHDGTHKA